ncbi:MAG: ABC transporter permease [Coriobacteriia bacterium]|nr:ABC transporter permease [Coriobacteriia bacterium]
MTPYDLANETVFSLMSNKVRSALTILGIVVGISAVIVMVAIGQGTQASITSSINSAGANLLMVTPGGERRFGPGGDGPGGGGGSHATLTDADVKVIQSLPNIANVAPEASGQYPVATASGTGNVRVTGVTGAYPAVRSIETSLGSFVADSDTRSSTKVAVLGPTTVTNLFGEGTDPVGETIRINGIRFTVIGVTKSKGGSGMGNQDSVVYIPMTTLQRFLTGTEAYSTIYVEASTSEAMSIVKQSITDSLKSSRRITDDSKIDFSTMSQSDLLSTASTITGTMTALLASIAGISLLVGGIGIMNMMLTTVTERTREIGLRKAIGARASDVTSQFLAESVALTVIGGVLGIALGWGASALITATGLLTAEVSWSSVALAVGVCAGIGVVFGYYPARRAAKLDPIEALRYQ